MLKIPTLTLWRCKRIALIKNIRNAESANHGLLLLRVNIGVAEHIADAETNRWLWNQPPKGLGRLPDFHGTLAFHPQKRLGRSVDLHVTLAFRLQTYGAGCFIFLGPWLSTPRSAWAGLWIFT